MAATDDTTVSIRDFRANLPSLLKRVQAGGALVVTSRGKPVARVLPPEPPVGTPRPSGLLKGQLTMSPDFDADDAELFDIMENGPIFPEEP